MFRCLAKTRKEHEDWFLRPDGSKRHPYGDAERRGFTGYGDTYTKLAIFSEAVVELYCHLRQTPDLSKRMADEMDINLEVFNLETDFFGDLHCSSRLNKPIRGPGPGDRFLSFRSSVARGEISDFSTPLEMTRGRTV